MAQRPDCDFLKVDHVLVAVILQSDIALVRSAPAVRFVGLLLVRYGLAFCVVGHLDAVHDDDGSRSVERNFHRVPLPRLLGASQCLGKRVENARTMVIVVYVVDLHFVTAVHRHPGLGGLFRNADEDAGVRVVLDGLEDDADYRVADLVWRVHQQSHPTVRFEEAVDDLKSSRANVLPARHVVAVKELLPLAGLRARGRGAEREKGERKTRETQDEFTSNAFGCGAYCTRTKPTVERQRRAHLATLGMAD